jgi:NAD(P)-dependent dehydrogenase (short-subunit alcohol dehydrogenase family)
VSLKERFLEGQHAIITGGGRGIGRATARALGEAGANLTLLGRSAPHLEAEANHIAGQFGVRVEAITTDVTQDDQVRQAFATAERTLGAPTILVNNAGQAEGAPFIQTSRELWDRMLAVNLTAAFTCIKQVLPAMLEAGRGRIINVASTAGLRGVQRVAAYSASKHGLIGLTRSLAVEVAKQGVTVNAVCPGYVDTDMSARAVDALMTGTGKSAEEAVRMISRPSAFGRLLKPEEVAGVIVWLCSPAAATVTGQAIVIGGDTV